jgi:hypothetical protein
MSRKDIDTEILKYMESIPFSATTEMVAKAVGIAWYTAQMHLMKLRDEDKVKYFRIGRQNQFILAKKMK